MRINIIKYLSLDFWPKDLVALGNPHFSLEEHGRMVELCDGRQKHPDVTVVITSGPEVWGRSQPQPQPE